MALLTFTPNTAVTQPEGTATTTFRFNENQTADIVVGTIRNITSGLDYRLTAQTGNVSRYKLVERMEGTQRVFDVVVDVGGDTNFNFETLAQHQITVEGFNSSNQRIDAGSFTFNLSNINERPTGVWLNTLNNTQVTLQENRPVDHPIATLGVVDPDNFNSTWGRPSVRYEVKMGDPETPFAHLYKVISDGSGGWSLAVNGNIDYDSLPANQKSHFIKIRATDGGGLFIDQLVVINLTNDPSDDGPTNPPPANVRFSSNNTPEVTILENRTAVGTVTATDADTLTYSLAPSGSSNNNNLFNISSSGALTLKAGADFETMGVNKFYFIDVQVFDGTNTVTQRLRVNIQDENEAPDNVRFQSTNTNEITIFENTHANYTVGTLIATDQENNTLNYSFAPGGNGGGLFTISQSGVITLSNGVDYEALTNKFYDLSVVVNDGANTITRSIRVNIQDMNEAPDNVRFQSTNTNAITINENTLANHSVGTLMATDPENNSLSFAFATGGNPGNLFDITSAGAVTLRNGVNYEALTNKFYDLSIVVSDGTNTVTRTVRVNIQDLNEAPDNVHFQSTGTNEITINENTLANHTVGTMIATDPDTNGTSTHRYSFATGGDAGGLFTISQSGAIRLINGVDYEALANKYYDLTVELFDGANTITRTVRVNIQDMNEAPDNVRFQSTNANQITIEENTPGNYTVGALTATDPELNNLTYGFAAGGNPGNLFDITSAGVITLRNGVNYEALTNKFFDLSVTVNDGTNTVTRTVRVNIGDKEEAPTLQIQGPLTFTATDTGSVAAPFGGVTLDDPENGTLTLKIEFARTDGELELVNGNKPTYEDILGNRVYTFTGTEAQLNDLLRNLRFNPDDRPDATTPSTVTTTFKISVRDNLSAEISDSRIQVNTTITDKDPGNHDPYELLFADRTTTATVAENTAGATLGILQGKDQDTADVLEFAIAQNGDPSGKFEVVETTSGAWVLKLKAGQSLDYENSGTNHRHVVKVVVTDGHGGSLTRDFTINVGDVAENVPNRIPSVPTLSNVTIQELAPNTTPVGTLSANDPDGNSLTYKIVSASGALVDNDGRFQIGTNQSGGYQLQVANGVQLDYEQAKQHSVTIEVSDGLGGTSRQTFGINVIDLVVETMVPTSASPLNDVIKGSKTGNFKDTFYGGAGDDKLWGGYGNDTLWGGVGKDVFVFDGKLGTSKTDRKVNYDTIKDYSVKDDSIWLEGDLFKSNKVLYAKIKKGTEIAPKKLESKFFTVGDKAKQADDYFVYDAKKRVLYYDADGSGSKAAIEMATFTNNKALKNFKVTELFFI